jgi:hypothetical protein
MSNDTYDLINNELNTQDEDNQEDCLEKHLTYQQKYYLLGLALQTPTSSLTSNEAETSNAALQAIPQGHMHTCPILSGILSSADALHGQAGGLKQSPIDRYLAEDLAERYALVDISPSDTGWQWARYSGCRCGL